MILQAPDRGKNLRAERVKAEHGLRSSSPSSVTTSHILGLFSLIHSEGLTPLPLAFCAAVSRAEHRKPAPKLDSAEPSARTCPKTDYLPISYSFSRVCVYRRVCISKARKEKHLEQPLGARSPVLSWTGNGVCRG